MGPFACARASRLLLRWFGATAVLALAACGGGGNGTDTAVSDSVSAAGAPQPGELPPRLLLGEPRNVDGTSKLALAWTSEVAFTGAITAQIWFGVNFSAGPVFELQHNGAPAFYVVTDFAGDEARFEMRYADGFFVLTAERDSTNDTMNFLVAITPFGVSNENPEFLPRCTGNDSEPCVHGSINNGNWPKRAGGQATLLIPRADPAMLTYGVFIKPSPTRDFQETVVGARGLSESFPRGSASAYDFPTASVKVRGCNAAAECIESEERSLQSALVRGVIPIDAGGPAPSGQVALNGVGDRMAYKHTFGSDRPVVLVLQREIEFGRWARSTYVENTAPGFGRTFALSDDGNTLAVEASPCAVTTVLCNVSSVFIYKLDPFGSQWTEQARFDGLRAPRLRSDGNLLAGIGVGAQRANTVAVVETDGGPWVEQAFPALNYTPLDLALSSGGRTLAVVRQGTLADPCGCRAVLVYDRSDAFVWTQGAVLRSNKRLDTVGSANDDGFGYASGTTRSLALTSDGSMIAVGASLDSSDGNDTVGDPANHNAPNSGAIYVFQRQPDNTYVKQAFIKPQRAAPLDHFGHSVVIRGTSLYGGARGLASQTPGVNRNYASDQLRPAPTPGAGGTLTGAAAYAFELTSTGWTHRATMIAPNADQADFSTFHGLAVGAESIVLATGAPDGAGGVARRMYVY